MAKNLIVNAIDANDNIKRKALTDINPAVDRGVLSYFADTLYGLSNDTVVAQTAVETAPFPATRRNPTITFSPATVADYEEFANGCVNGWFVVDIDYDGDGTVYFDAFPDLEAEGIATPEYDDENDPTRITSWTDPNVRIPNNKCVKVVPNGSKWQLWIQQDFELIVDSDTPSTVFLVKATDTPACNAAAARFTIAND